MVAGAGTLVIAAAGLALMAWDWSTPVPKDPVPDHHVVFTFQWGPFSRSGSAPLRGYRTVPFGLMVAVSAAGPQKRDFSHAGTASTAVRRLRTRPNRMKPGFHLALTRW